MGIGIIFVIITIILLIISHKHDWIFPGVAVPISVICAIAFICQGTTGDVSKDDVAKEYSTLMIENQYFLYNANENVINQRLLTEINEFNVKVNKAKYYRHNFFLRNIFVDDDYAAYEPIELNLKGIESYE